MKHLYAYQLRSPDRLYFFLLDQDTNLRTSYTGNLYDLSRKSLCLSMSTVTSVFDPADTYFLLSLQPSDLIPDKSKLLTILHQRYPELSI